MRYTNLKLINKCLEAIGADSIESADFSDEYPTKILSMIEDVYYDIVFTKDKSHYGEVHKLEPVTYGGSTVGVTTPTKFFLYISDDGVRHDVRNVSHVSFNRTSEANLLTDPDYIDVQYLDPESFLKLNDGLSSDFVITDVGLSDDGYGICKVRTDVDPSYYTSFDNQTVVFDAYDITKDTGGHMDEDRLRVVLTKYPLFLSGETDIQDIEINMWPEFVRACQSMVFSLDKDGPNQGLEIAQRRARVFTQKDTSKVTEIRDRANYGRRN
jgi:hypothetical protein